MLRLKNSQLRLMTQGYHFDDHGKKFVRIWVSFSIMKIQIKIQPKKEMHIRSINVHFPYTITKNWVEIVVDWSAIDEYITDYVDRRCREIWFV